MERYDAFEQYIRATEPGPKERAELWQTAIGLQKVDGLEVSDYLVDTAKKHIEGEVSIDDVDKKFTRKFTRKKHASSQEKPDVVLKMLEDNPNINLQDIADKLNMTRRGVQKITDKLKSEGRLMREDSTKSGKWIVKR